MNRRMIVAGLGAACALLLLAPGHVPQALASDGPPVTDHAEPVHLDAPTLADPRLRPRDDGFVADVAVRLRSLRSTESDRVQVQLAVTSPIGGPDIVGPVRDVPVTGYRLMTSVPLTDEQAEAVRAWRSMSRDDGFAAGAVTAGVRHEADLAAAVSGLDAIAVDARRAVWEGPTPVPPVAEYRDFASQITFANTTSSPLVLLAGPVSCMWDANYPYTNGEVKDSDFLAQSNGAILPPGTSWTTASEAAASITDSKYVDTATQVLTAYTSALTSSYSWFKRTPYGATMPDVPTRSSLPVGVTASQTQLIRSLVNLAMQDALKENGTGDLIYDTASAAAGVAGAFLADEVDFDLPGDQILAIIGAIFDALEATCSTGDNTLLVGATSIAEPWRQFVGFYEWDGSRPALFQEYEWLEPGKTIYRPYVNGMLVQVFAGAQPGSSTTAYVDDSLALNFDPSSVALAKEPIVWSFSEPDLSADHPAVVSVTGRTLTCNLDPRDVPGQAAAMRTVKSDGASMFMTAYPVPVWQNLDNATIGTNQMPGGGAGGPGAYVNGIGYAAPGTPGTSVFYTSADGVTWSEPIPAPANTNSIIVPASSTVRLVQCTTQSIETYSGPVTYNGRRVIMGTRVMSDMVLGPDA